MAGELWNQQFEIGNETTAGTAVARTRRMYFTEDSVLTKERDPRPHSYVNGSRQQVKAFTLGPQVVKGKLTQALGAGEIIEFLLMAINGTTTPTGGGTTKLWTFTPGSVLDFCTLGWNDGARAWRAAGVYGNKLTIKGDVKKGIEASLDVMGMAITQTALTGGFSDRVPSIIEGWESRLYIDAFAGTPGSTQVTGTLINWNIEIDNMLAAKNFAENSNALQAITVGPLMVKAKLLFEAAPSAVLTEFNNWNTLTSRLVRIDMGNNTLITGSDYEYVRVDIPGAWDAVDLGQTDENTRAYEMGLQYIYDPTNAFGLQVIAQNARASGY